MNAPTPPPPTLLNDSQVNDPDVLSEATVDTPDGPGVNLYVEVFVRSEVDPKKWQSAHPNAWPLLATVTPNKIRTFPIYLNPHAQRYLRPQHGMFTSVVYEDESGSEIPADVHEALRQLSRRLPGTIFKDFHEGLGLQKEFNEVVQTIAILGRDAALKVVEHGESRIEGDEVVVSEDDMDSLRRAMNRIDRRKRDGVRDAKRGTVLNDLLTKLDPVHFGRIEPVKAKPLASRATGRAQSVRALQRQAGEAAVSRVRASLPVLAAETPAVLMQLQADIERVTLEKTIARYEELLAQELPESEWQKFFEKHQFALSLAFARPVQLVHTQFHAQGSGPGGSGAQIGDFLFRQTGRGLAIVEIKKPGTELLSTAAYRNEQVYAPSRELGGAVTQTLIQQNALRMNWTSHHYRDRKLWGAGSEAIQCVVIAGRLPEDENKLGSFEAFRHACKDVVVLTFDELLEKLRYIRDELNPKQPVAGAQPLQPAATGGSDARGTDA